MKISRFQHLAEAYGAGIERWPEAERAAAWALLTQSPDAQRRLARARVLDVWLSRATSDDDGDAAAARVVAAIGARLDRPPGAHGVRVPGSAGPRAFWPAAAGFLAAMGVMGVLAGNLGFTQRHSAETGVIASLVYPTTAHPIVWNR